VNYHSPIKPEQGDAIIIEASRIETPLKPETVKAIDGVWGRIKHEAPLDNLWSVYCHAATEEFLRGCLASCWARHQ